MALSVGDDRGIAKVRQAVLFGALCLAALTALVVLAARMKIASWFGGGAISHADVAWLGVAAAATIAAGAQTAMLNGFRRIGDLARLTIIGSIVGTVAGLLAIWFTGQQGILIFIISAPILNLCVGQIFVARLPNFSRQTFEANDLIRRWRGMASLGIGLMATSLAGSGGPLIVRTFLEARAGAEALGLFQASWMISMNYLTFVLVAMGTDFFPRLSSAIENHQAANEMVNEQMAIAILLVGPLLTGMIAFAPLIIHILYAESFIPASAILRWQVLGDLLKVVSWPLGIIVLASGKTFTAFLLEAAGMGAFAAATIFLFPVLGIQATGVAFIVLYCIYLPLVFWRAHSITGFVFSPNNVVLIGVTLVIVAVTAFIGNYSSPAGMLFGGMAAGAMALRSADNLIKLTGRHPMEYVSALGARFRR